MYSDLNLLEAREQFDTARRHAFWRAVGRIPGRYHTLRLPALDRVLNAARFETQASRGVQEIHLDKVVGTVTKAKQLDFDSAFLPLARRQRERWARLYAFMSAGYGDVPPIEVYQLESNYYVIDGHHRVSIARELGRDRIEAKVTEIKTRAPIGSDLSRSGLQHVADYARFLEKTGLDRVRPQARVALIAFDRYDELHAHIVGHKYFVSLEQHRDVPFDVAAASWYDNVFVPVNQLVHRHEIVKEMRNKSTPVDAYMAVTKTWLERGDVHAAVHSMLERLRTRPRRRLFA
jgi:uncharacterized ParB-like nuclease family protein